MSRRDKATLALIGFFFVIASTIELYFLVAHGRLVAAASHHPLAWLLSLYGPSDRAYFDAPSSLALSFEGLQVAVTQPLGAALAYAIVRRRAWRWPLQLAVGAYVTYSVILYFLVAHVSGSPACAIAASRPSPSSTARTCPGSSATRGSPAMRRVRSSVRMRSAPAVVERDRVLPSSRSSARSRRKSSRGDSVAMTASAPSR